MYAIFSSGGKQYRASEGNIIRLEKLNFQVGKTIKLNNILIFSNGSNIKCGKPFLEQFVITAQINAHGRSKKINIIKFNRRKHYKKQQGHRQWFTDIQILKISNIHENINNGT